jgi:hypothetical protein
LEILEVGSVAARRLVVVLVLAAALLAALAAFAVPARAGLLSCSSGTQVFAPWGDASYYYLAPNGDLEGGSSGWTLSGGATVVSANEPFLGDGSNALSLPSGSTATSPRTCIGPTNDFVRMFAADLGGADSGLRVRVVWYGLLSNVLGVTDVTTFAPAGDWAPSSKIVSIGGLPALVPPLGSSSARIQLTPVGAGSKWLVDDLYVDPYYCR